MYTQIEGMVTTMKQAIKGLQKAQIALAGFFLMIFMITVLIQIFSRYLGISVMWTQEVAGYSFIWSLFMGAGAMVYEKRHFAFTSISDMLKNKRIKSILGIIISLIMLFFSVLMVYYGFMLTKQFWAFKWVTLPSFNRGPTWLCMPVCGITSCIYLLSHIVEDTIAVITGGKK